MTSPWASPRAWPALLDLPQEPVRGLSPRRMVIALKGQKFLDRLAIEVRELEQRNQ
jgi:hypothetical protein